jgi:signal transduction histidine kinase/ActR/RegA family two-component response regulator
MRPQEKQEELLRRERAARADAEAARAEAEAAHSRLSFLAEASRILGGSLEYETTLRNLARLTIPQLADLCVVDLAEDGERIRRVAVADIDPNREELMWRIARQHPLTVRSPPSYARVISTGEPQWVPELTDEMCPAAPEDVDPDVIHRLKFRSFICVPLPVHGQILGSISLARSTPSRPYDSLDLALAEELARRAGLAVDHARLYRASQQANRVKDEFLATLSHELRSPLSSALLCAQMLRRGILDEAKSKRALETIERKISLEVRLVDDLVDVARIASGKVSLVMETVELASVVHSAVEGARPAADAQGICMELMVHDIEASIRGDEERLEQVMGNLLSNAIKFTPKGGSVEVTLERVGSQAQITVRDTGIGISAKALPEIFDRFRQVDTSSTRKYGGLGLGLAIVHNLVDLHGGTVTAQSPGEGHGATFTILLPLLPSDTYFVPRSSVESQGPLGEMKHLDELHVLVVDDDDDAREWIATLLTTRGARVTTAASASEALEVLQRGGRQDVLVIDIGMPGVDGYALLRAIRDRGSVSVRVPAIAVTAYAGTKHRQLALAAGYQLHLSKPIDQNDLVAAVAELAGRRQSRPGERPGLE